MGRTISEGDDKMFSRDQSASPQADFGGADNGGMLQKKGPWTSAEDAILVDYVKKHGEGNWNAVQKHSGLSRCGKSCRLRWANHLRPNLKKGPFSLEEERIIIELHAKMGNKWARMAANLPGRTDNEIKNYWNTRIKRRQRAGLPIYPPEVCLQACQENQQNQSAGGNYNVENQHHDLLQNQNFEAPDVVFDGMKANPGFLPYIPELADISSGGMLMKGLGSSHLHSFLPPTTRRPKRLRDSMNTMSIYGGCIGNGPAPYDHPLVICDTKSSAAFDPPFPYEPDHMTKSFLSYDANESNNLIFTDNISASKPLPGAVKLELPSLQTNIGGLGLAPPPPFLETVDAFIQSPPYALHQSDCPSPRNSGLLDALVHESKTMSCGKNQLSDKSTNSSSLTPGDIADSSTANICPAEWDEIAEPISPLGNSQASIFSECTPISTSGSSLEDSLPGTSFAVSKVKSEPCDPTWILNGEQKETSTRLDLSRPDVLLGSCWLDQNVSCGKKHGSTDAIAALLGVDDFGSDTKGNMPSTTPLSSSKLGFGAYAWNNMPPVRQMPDCP